MKKRAFVFFLCLLSAAFLRAAPAVPAEEMILKQLRLLNQIPEDQLSEKIDPAFSILRKLYDADGPDFLRLKKLLAAAEVRSKLNPSARCVLAGVISQRWDTFTLSGNLYLSGLQSKNADIRAKARKKLVGFIQPAHIPILIELLKIPGPNVLAYDILQELTGKKMDPSTKIWQKWWVGGGARTDIVGHLLNDTRSQLDHHVVHDFDQERYWYLPEGLADAQTPYSLRSEKEQMTVSQWNNWANSEVRRYADDWALIKPVVDRLIHQPDPRVNKFLETMTSDPGYGDYASVVLAWRSSAPSLGIIQRAYQVKPTVGRALARGSLGDKTALVDLLRMIEHHQSEPLSYKIMDDDARGMLSLLRTVGVIPAEQAFELLSHQSFDFEGALRAKEKKKAFQKAKAWLKNNASKLALDRRRGYYKASAEK